MKKTNTTTRNKRLLRYGASALILTILFVFVFASALTASFAVEENAIENGQLEANVAEAAGTWENGVDSFNNGFTTYNVWNKVDFGTAFGATDNRNRTLSASGDLSTFIGYNIVKCRLQHRVTDDSSSYTFTFYVKKNNSSGTTMINQSHTLNAVQTYTSDWYTDTFPTTLYFYCSSGGKTTNWSTVLDVLIEFAAKSYTITINNQSATTAGTTATQNVTGGGTVSAITRAYRLGYTLQGYYTGTNGTGTKIYNADGSVNKGTTYIDSSGRWIKNESPTAYAYWVKNTGTIIYDKNAPTGATVSGSISNITVQYNTAFTFASSGFTCSGYTLIGWSRTSTDQTAEYTKGQNMPASTTNSAPFRLSEDGDAFTITVYAIWKQSDFGRSPDSGHEGDLWGSQYNPFIISTPQHLINLATIVNADTTATPKPAFDSVTGYSYETVTTQATSTDFSGCWFRVSTNITGATTAAGVIPIGVTNRTFKGTFDGNGKTITLTLSSTTFTALFGRIGSGAYIKNLTIAGTVSGTQYVAGLVAYADAGTVENCTNQASVTGTGQTAGIIGQATASFTLKGTILNTGRISGGGMTGGIGGQYHGTFTSGATITNGDSSSANHATKGYITGTGDSVGGCFGFFDKSAASVTLTNYGKVEGTTALGGIVGRNQNVISGATNYGNVTSSGATRTGEIPFAMSAVGGISGYTSQNISGCTNNGTISVSASGVGIGGIVGTYMGTPTISGCTNNGTISCSTAQYVGGITGYWASTISGCHSKGNVTGSTWVGGIAGFASGTVENCDNDHTISGGQATAGIVGGLRDDADGTLTITGSHNTATISASGGNGVGGILGRTGDSHSYTVTISGSYNTGIITGGDNVGGIFGRAVTTATASNTFYIHNCYNTGEVSCNSSSGNDAGGIVGYFNMVPGSSTNNRIGRVAYCYNSGVISSRSGTSTRVGSVVGMPNYGGSGKAANILIEFCYSIEGLASNSNAPKKVVGHQASYATIQNSWTFVTASVTRAAEHGNLAVILNSGTVTPYLTSSESTAKTWTDILSDNLNGFYVGISIADGKYFSSRTSNDTTVDNNYYTPSSVKTAYSSNPTTVELRYAANLSGNTLYCSSATPTTSASNGEEYTYNGAGQGTTVTVPAASPYSLTYLYTGTDTANASYSDAGAPTNCSKDGTSYTMGATINLSGSAVGHIARTFKIVKVKIKITNTWTDHDSDNSYDNVIDRSTTEGDRFIYNGANQGIASYRVESLEQSFVIYNGTYYRNVTTSLGSNPAATIQNINSTYFKNVTGRIAATDSNNEQEYTFTIELNATAAYNCQLVDNTGTIFGTDGSKVVFKYKIRRLAFDDTQFVFGYHNGDVANMPKAQRYDPSQADYYATSANFYPNATDWALNYSVTAATATSRQNNRPALVYQTASHKVANFCLFFKSGGTAGTGDVVTLEQGTTKSYTVSVLPVVDENTPTMDATVTLTGYGNFSGTITIRYKLMLTDFGYDPAHINDGNWGSETNPFLIEDITHLLRLTQIVNGESSPWNSTDSRNPTQVADSITAVSYRNAYFKVMASINVPATAGFIPIGSNGSYYFAGTFDGNSNTITLDISTSNRANVGLFGYALGLSNNKAVIKNLTVAGSVSATGSGNNNVGGIVGYGSHVTFDQVLNSATVSGGQYVGGVIGQAATGTTFTYVVDSAIRTRNTGTVSGTSNVGGIVGRAAVMVASATNSAAVSGTNYIGGIAGDLSSGTLQKVVNSGNISATGNYVGGLVGKFVPNAALVNVSSTGTVSGLNVVGGYFGWISGSTAQTITTGTYSAAVSASGTVGFVGGVVGYANLTGTQTISSVSYKGLVIKDSTRTGTVIAANGSRVGGFVGYGSNVHFINSSNTTNSLSNNTNDKRVQGKNYVGGLAGELSLLNISDSNIANILAGTATPNCTGAGESSIDNDSAVCTDVYGSGDYVGGYVGKFWTSVTINLTPVMRRSFETLYDTKAQRAKVAGNGFVGAVFGYVKGNGYHEAASDYHESKIVIDKTDSKPNVVAWVQNTGTGNVIGGVVGYASGVAIYIAKDIETSYFFKSDSFDVSTYGGQFTVSAASGTNRTSYWGGLVGVLGTNATIVAATAGGDGGTYKVWADTSVAAAVAGSYVGGVVGFITARAGVYLDAGTTLFGNNVGFEHRVNNTYGAIIANGDFVGGIIGFMGIGSNNTSVSLPTDIAGDLAASGNVVRFDPRYGAENSNRKGFAQNSSNVQGTNYVGGIVGCVGASDTLAEGARVQFENKQLTGGWSTMANDVAVFSANDSMNIKGTTNVGGIIGALTGNMNSSELKYVFATANAANSSNGVTGTTNVGGLVGRIDNGTIGNCFFARLTSGDYTESRVYGTSAVGGLVGLMNGGEVKNNVGMAYILSDCSETKSGVIGTKLGGTLTDSWAFYYKADADYPDAVDSTRGKGVIITTSKGATKKTPTINEIAQMVGLVANASSTNATTELAGAENYISVAIGLPTAQYVSSVRHDYHLVFYTATGEYATYAVSNFDGKASVSNVVYIKLAMSKASFSICTKEVKFGDIERVNSGASDKTQDAKNKVTAAFKTPAQDSTYHVTVNTATYNNSTYYVTGASGFVWVGVDSFKVGNFEKTITVGSSETPYIIANQTDWNNFASNVRGGTTYYGEYVKLTTNAISVTTSNLAGDVSVDSDTHNFKGTFDGDGHTISVNITNAGQARMSVFPNAAGATFKNLNISGKIDAINFNNNYLTSTSQEDINGQQLYYGDKTGNKPYWLTDTQKNGYDTAGFVAKPFGNVTFVNCTNSVNVSGYRDVGGFVGYVGTGITVTIIDCVNTGTIRSYEYVGPYDQADQQNASAKQLNFDGGTGGLIGDIKGDAVIDSCRNDGNVRGPQNIGGIVGRTSKTLSIYNCANTGNITGDSGYDTDCKEGEDKNTYIGGYCAYEQTGSYCCLNYVGGILGKTAGSQAALNLYASYNEGTITAYGSIAGGLVGSVGTYIPKETFAGGSPDQTDCGVASTIAYCYNKGKVQAGGDSLKSVQAWIVNRVNRTTGSMAGGIVGCFASGKIAYCYNTANVIAWGGDGYSGIWINRVAGIVAHAQPAGTSSYSNITIDNCYNTGLIEAPATHKCIFVTIGSIGWGDNSFTMGGTIVGFIDTADSASDILAAVTITNCYSTPYCYHNNKRDSNNIYAHIGTSTTQASSGHITSLSGMTALMRSNGVIAPDGDWISGGSMTGKGTSVGSRTTSSSVTTLVDSSGNSIKNTSNELNPTYTNAFKNGTLNGWIYIYGCLPQLAVFTLGTKKGMSMLATSYGRDTDGDFVPQQAGGQFSPYIIRDGIHLLGMTALTSADVSSCYYTFNNRYVEFANGDSAHSNANSNNIKNETTLAIRMPTAADDSNAYKGTTTETGSTYVTSKGYFLFTEGAVMSAGDRTSSGSRTSQRTNWQNKNYYYSSQTATSMTAGGTIATSQFWPIGSVGHKSIFCGSLDAKGGLVRGLNLYAGSTSGVELGLFIKVQNATIKNLGISGSVVAYSTSSTASHVIAAGGIVGRIGAGTVIDGCYAGYNSSYTLTVKATASSLTPTGYAGGIVGVADTLGYNASGTAIDVEGGKTYIKNCQVKACYSSSDASVGIFSFKNTEGGIVGYATASRNIDGTTINIENCKVLSARIQSIEQNNSTATLGINAGGILGTHDSKAILNITGCEVGSSSYKAPQASANVLIRGENSIGGIIGAANRYLTITDTKVFGDVKIARANSWGTVRNHDSYNTAIGGLIGYTPTSVDGNAPNIILGGTLIFAGTVDANQATTAGSNTNIQSVGGIAGFLGAGTQFASGAQIYIVGAINTGSQANVTNIGGVVGEVANAAFSGTFFVAPNMTVSTATNVGGFIGTATGTCTILADDTDIHIGGTISAKQYVGGFIGIVGNDSTLAIGPATYNGVDYSKGVKITIHGTAFTTNAAGIPTYIPTSAVAYSITCNAASISATQTDVGGIVGKNLGGAGKGVNIQKGTIINGGAVSSSLGSGETNVGGVIGNNSGTLTIASAATVSNSGSVTGKDYVGGIIGKMGQGALSGSFANSGNVTGVNYVGGSIGFMANGTSISASGAQSTFNNSGNVTGTGSYVGGSIGAMLGSITGFHNMTTTYRVKFINSGAVNGKDYLGGSIGVLAGGASWAAFVNNGAVDSTGTMCIGGSIGIIGLPPTLSALGHDTISYQNNHAEYNSSEPLEVTPTSAQSSASGASGAVAGHGGVGGVIGVIASDITWDGENSFYVAGDVSAETVDNVGGTIGLVLLANLTINDLLAYDTLVDGRNNVGGIIGAVGASGVGIYNSFNVTIDNDTKGVDGDAFVGGIVGYAPDTTVANTSYWVKGYHNDELASLNINSLSTDLGKVKTISSNNLKTSPTNYKNIVGADVNITKDIIELYETPNDFRSGLNLTQTDDPATNQNTWEYFLSTTFFNVPSGYTIDTSNVVFTKTSFTPYTTGTEHTGYYFVYSNDMRDGSSNLLINTVYSTSNVAGSRNEDYWKYIANNYSDGETRPVSGLSSSIIYHPENGYNGGGSLTSGTNGDKLHVVAAGAEESGYYLYVASSGGERALMAYGTKNTSDNDKVHIFVQADKADNEGEGAPAENVVIYFRSVTAGKDLDYNGYARYAPISIAESEIPYVKTESAAQTKFTTVVNEVTTYGYGYVYVVYKNTGTNENPVYVPDDVRHVLVGDYTAPLIKIFYVENETIYQMGYIENMDWKIKQHTATISTVANASTYGRAGSYDGTGTPNSGINNSTNTIVVTVKGIANKDTSNAGNFVEFSFTVVDMKTGNAYAITTNPAYYNTTNSALVNNNLGLDLSKVLVTYGTSATSTAPINSVIPTNDSSENKSKAYTAAEKADHNFDDLSTANPAPVWNTYQFVFHFKNANTSGYKIDIALVNHQAFANARNVSVECYKLSGSTSATLRINPISLATAAGATDSSDYTGDFHENDFWVGRGSGTTWYSLADAAEALPEFGMSIVYLDKNGTKQSDVAITGAGTGSVSAGDYAISVVGAAGYYCTFTISNFKNRGSYYIKFNTLEYGNYKVNAPQSDNDYWKTIDGKKCLKVFGITENELTITWNNKTSKVYDGEVISDVQVTFNSSPSKDPMTNMLGAINEIFTFYNGTKQVTLTSSDVTVSGRTLTIKAGFFTTTSAKSSWTNGDQAGSYNFTIKGNSTDNVTVDYEHSNGTKGEDAGLKYTKRTYTISKKALTVSLTGLANNASAEYDTYHHGVTQITISDLISKDTISTSSKGLRSAKIIVTLTPSGTASVSDNGSSKTSGKINVTDCINAGSYTCTVSIDSNNYTLTGDTTRSWTITQHVISLTGITGGVSIEYDGKEHVPTLTIGGAPVDNGKVVYNQDTITVNLVYSGGTGDGKMKNAGIYTISVNSSSKFTAKKTGTNTDTTSNYTFSNTAGTANFEITQAPLTVDFQNWSGASLGSGAIAANAYTYNGRAQGVKQAVVTGFKNNETLATARVATFTATNVAGTISGANYTLAKTVNVVSSTTYSLSVASGDNTSSTYAQYNYYLTASSSLSYSWSINPLAIVTTAWNNPGTAGNPVVPGYYLYTGAEISPTILSITLGGNAVTSPATTTYDDDDDLFLTTFNGPYTDGNEKVIIEISEASGGNRVDVGNYSAHANGFRVSGSNEAGDTTTNNYSFAPASQLADEAYHITPGVVVVTITGPTISKVYDGGTATPQQRPTFTITLNGNALEGGASLVEFYKSISTNESEKNYGTYDTKDVGTGKTVTYWAKLADGGNYAFSWSKSGENEPVVAYKTSVSAAIGTITTRDVTITLNLRNKKAYKTYDGTVKYAEWRNATSGNDSRNSDNYRAGQGFKVTGVLGETAETVNILAEIYEADGGRTGNGGFDVYVNNVYKPTSSTYAIGGKTAATTFYKKLKFTISGSNAGNYNYTIQGGGNTYATRVERQSGQETLVVTLFDSSDTTNAGGQAELHIAINQKTVTANYSPLTQSYANADNTLNTTWTPVTGTLTGLAAVDSSNVSVAISNGWRYTDGKDDGTQIVRTYDKYTAITGREGNKVLGAQLTSTSSGKHLNYALRKQPTLVIGYFVVKDGYYEVGSMAGLILATYYYRMNFEDTETEGSGVNVAPTELVWYPLASDSAYASGTGYPQGYESWEEYFQAEIDDYNEGKAEEDQVSLIYNENADSWGYWKPQAIARTSYLRFMQVKNIDGTLSASDLVILEGQFGQNWQTYVPNFVPTTTGNVITAIGSFFPTVNVVTARNEQGTATAWQKVPFIGEYNGVGYTIDHVNLIGYAPISNSATTFNVGMFEEIGSASVTTAGNKTVSGVGIVSGINLRNWNVGFSDYNSDSSNVVNVGGVVGLSNQTQALDQCSFHGIINVYSLNGTVNVGGIVGKYDDTNVSAHNAIEGAIAVGNMYITAQNVNAGGIIGNLASDDCAVKDVVALMGIFSTANGDNTLGGLIGTTSWVTKANALTVTSGKTNAYVADSVINMNGNGSVVSKQIGNGSTAAGVTYTALMSGSTSAYDSVNSYKYLGLGSTTTPGAYDMLEDRTVASTAKYESPRLKDIIMVYVLHYGLTSSTATIGTTPGIAVYQMQTTSSLVGTALGTDGSKISIGNQQQVAYLREFRFACFNLERDVDMYNLYQVTPFEGSFYGSVTANGHVINLRNSAQAKMFKIELSTHALPISIDT